MLPPDPVLLKSLILLLPTLATGIAFNVHRPGYFQMVGLLLGFLLCIPYLFLLNILAQYAGWWAYADSANTWYSIPVEIVLGWSVFWGVLLPYVLRSLPVPLAIAAAVFIDLLLMPEFGGLFTLGEYWLIGEGLCLMLVFVPALLIFKLTWQRKHVLLRALIQSVIWGGWTVFLLPAIVLQVDGKSIFDVFGMQPVAIVIFTAGMLVSMLIGYLALYEFAAVGGGTPIPFDPPQRLVVTGVYSVVANPLQISTLLMLTCIMFAYRSYLMLVPIAILILYCEIFVRWHHSIDIEQRFHRDWEDYRSKVNNWVPQFRC